MLGGVLAIWNRHRFFCICFPRVSLCSCGDVVMMLGLLVRVIFVLDMCLFRSLLVLAHFLILVELGHCRRVDLPGVSLSDVQDRRLSCILCW